MQNKVETMENAIPDTPDDLYPDHADNADYACTFDAHFLDKTDCFAPHLVNIPHICQQSLGRHHYHWHLINSTNENVIQPLDVRKKVC